MPTSTPASSSAPSGATAPIGLSSWNADPAGLLIDGALLAPCAHVRAAVFVRSDDQNASGRSAGGVHDGLRVVNEDLLDRADRLLGGAAVLLGG
jgi:hypothetical protein